MCEIAIKYNEHEPETFTEWSMDIYRSMRSSLGITGVNITPEEFEYTFYKSTDPSYNDVHDFFVDNDDVSLFIIHGRLATTGAVIDENSHPLHMECEECSVDHIVHNGIVSGYETEKTYLESKGHTFATDVDTEVIGHSVGKVPTSFDEELDFSFMYQPGVILMNDTTIYINVSPYSYRLSKRPELAKKARKFAPRGEDTYSQVILRPPEVNE